MALGIRLRSEVLPAIEEKIEEIAVDADLDEEPEGHFERVRVALRRIENATQDAETTDLVESARHRIGQEIRSLTERKDVRDQERDQLQEVDWSELLQEVAPSPEPSVTPEPESRPRSVFDDVDHN